MRNIRRRATKKSIKGSKPQLFFLNFGKLMLDVAKLCFVALVLGAVIKFDFPPATMLNKGIIVSGALAIFGLVLTTVFGEK